MIRWWFHTNGTKTPGYDSERHGGEAVQQSHIDGVKAILSAAPQRRRAASNISLWSFDMLQSNAGNHAHSDNQALLENDTNRQAYIDNYLTPLVTAHQGDAGPLLVRDLQRARRHGTEGVGDRQDARRPRSRRR